MMPPEIRAALNRPQSALHTALLEYGRARIRASKAYWSQRHPAWQESERLHRSFREPDRSDVETRNTSETEGVEKIVVPYSYAVTQSMLAFFLTVFTDRKPIIPVEGVGDTAPRAALAHEEILQIQLDAQEPRGPLQMLQQIFDSLRYGPGVLKNTWGLREWPDVRREITPIVDPVTGEIRFQDRLIEEDVIEYEGNIAMNVSPFAFFPDPRCTFSEFQKGEFVAHYFRQSETSARQKQAQGLYAGLQFLSRSNRSGGDLTHGTDSELARTLNMSDAPRTLDQAGGASLDTYEMWTYLDPALLRDPTAQSFMLAQPIPRGTPRLWVLTIANEDRVIRAEPARLPGRRFPFTALELNFDVHSPTNISMIETFRGLQYILSWLFNSRMRNVRKTLNNELIIDPSMLNPDDYLRPNPGGLWRLAKSAQGGEVDLSRVAVPLPTVDVTANHHADARVVTDLIEQITGANRLIMGLPNPGRRAATEVQGQLSLASGRMKLLALVVSAQAFEPWAQMMIRNNQAFMREPMTVRLRPEYAQLLGEEVVRITPELLQGRFRTPFLESGMPTDKQFEANVWREVLNLGAQNPAAAQSLAGIRFDQVFRRLLRVMGVKNIGDFFTMAPQPATVMPTEDVDRQVQQGNLVPRDNFPLGAASAPNTPGPQTNGLAVAA